MPFCFIIVVEIILIFGSEHNLFGISELQLGGSLASLVALAVTVVALGIAWRQTHKANRAKEALNAATEEIPGKVAGMLRATLESLGRGGPPEPLRNKSLASAVEYADVNGDGRGELLVQYPSGAHGSGLKIFAWDGDQFRELACLGVDTPSGFEFGDFDGDGRVEIRAQETDWTAGLPYVSAPRVMLLRRWNGTEFAEVSRQESAGSLMDHPPLPPET